MDEAVIQSLVSRIADDLAWPTDKVRFRSYETGPIFDPRFTSYGIRKDILEQLDLDEIEFALRLHLGHGQFMPRPAPFLSDVEDQMLGGAFRGFSRKQSGYRVRYQRSSAPRKELAQVVRKDPWVRTILSSLTIVQLPVFLLALRGLAPIAILGDLVLFLLCAFQVWSARSTVAGAIVIRQACEKCGFEVAYAFLEKARHFPSLHRYRTEFLPKLEKEIKAAEQEPGRN